MNISNKIFNVKASYVVIFLSLVIWSFFAFFTMTEIISSQKIYGKLINVSGKQRMLSQKTTLIAKRFLETKDQFLLAHLKELIEEMQKDHLFLINNLTSSYMMNIYFKKPYHVDFQVQSYLNLLNDFIQKQDKKTISKIEQSSFKLLPILDYAVNAFEKESDAQVLELKRRELFILIGTLFTLIIEALFIMIPALRIVKKSREKLMTFNSELQKEVEKKTKQIQLELPRNA